MKKDKNNKCDVCGKDVKSMYYDLKHNIQGHKNCVKYYDPNKPKQLNLPLEDKKDS